MSFAIDLAEQGRVPDFLVRLGIKGLVQSRLRQETRHYRDAAAFSRFCEDMARSALAVHTDDANAQHYEVPAAFFETVLGHRLKYSCALFPPSARSLDDAEDLMLALTCERARLADGMEILELGCGWGSLTLWMAEAYPQSRITAVSNSGLQREFIDKRAAALGLANIEVITCDINNFETDKRFDRVVSVEMFEHLRNYALLFERISGWLQPDGMLFFHIFCHRHFPYFFEDSGDGDWMARQFFTGGMMPSWELPLAFQSHLTLVDRWALNGQHYARTCREWLARCDHNKEKLLPIFAASNDPALSIVQFNRWRLFFLACESLFAANQGNEWHVGHYLFRRV